MQNSNFLSNISNMLWLTKNNDHPITEDDLNEFVPELQDLIQQLDCLLATIYRDTKRTYEYVLHRLRILLNVFLFLFLLET